MLSKFLDPKNDLAFKRIFGSERNKGILIHFLNDLFGNTINPIEEVTFLKTALDPEVASQRASIVDVLCHDSSGDYFIIEMQVNFEPGFEKRAQYYAAKAYIQQRDKGIEYKELKSVTFLAITSYPLFPEEDGYLSHHHTLNINNFKRRLKDFSFSFLELAKFKKSKEELVSMTEKWAYFFKHAPQTKEEDLKTIIGSDLIIQQAYDELNRFSWSEEELRTYDGVDMKRSADRACYEGALETGHKQGMQEGIEIGLQKGVQKGLRKGMKIGREEGLQEGVELGRHQERLKLARQLLDKGFDPNEVAEMTGLAVEEFSSV